MELAIKKASVNDATTLALLAQITFKEAFGHIWDKEVLRNYLKHTFSVQKMKGSIEKSNNVFWLAYADELPVGYAKLKICSPYDRLADPKPAQLQKIYVLNDYIGNKIGQRLQEALFEQVKTEGVKTLWLAVWDGNEKAIQFYERHGFKKETTYRYDFESMSFDYEVMVKPFG
ncbi:MAG: GNAT family N-acetyltransferase [Chitinophagaceae bacterium]|nr:GNAT family N-acetyltransferase [Chitinophagaceae bacterium]